MRHAIALLAFLPLLSGQSPPPPVQNPAQIVLIPVHVWVKPISLVTTKKVIGEGRTAGVWTVDVCQDTNLKLSADRARILSGAMAVHVIPNRLAEDAIGRQGNADPKSILGTYGDEAIGLASDGGIIGGLAAGSSGALYVGAGLKAAQLIFRILKKAAPDASPYYSDLLPAQVAIPALGCSPQYYVFASLAPKVVSIDYTVQIPVASQ